MCQNITLPSCGKGNMQLYFTTNVVAEKTYVFKYKLIKYSLTELIN